jgi:predicted nucleotidyltransferase component of viral defense system
MAKVDYQALYKLQDKALEAMFRNEVSFYLTGGTCLHRFHFQKRYSDDLDFFSNENELFREDARIFLDTIASEKMLFERTVDSRDFLRVVIDNELKIDLVNDRVNRYGRPKKTNLGFKIDTIENIFSNKICAILSRDEPKDVFDFFTIYQSGRVKAKEMLEAALKKCSFDIEGLEYRLRSFPVELLDTLSVVDESYVTGMKTNYSSLIHSFLNEIG